MTTNRTTRTIGKGMLLLFLLGAAGCSSGGSARTDYFAARSITRSAQPGDGSVIAIGPRATDSAWTASLSYVPTAESGDFAAGGE